MAEAPCGHLPPYLRLRVVLSLYYHAHNSQRRLPNIRFHDLRHTAATLMFQQGIHPKIVQERLGRADISLTLNTYSHVLPNMQEEAAEKFDFGSRRT